MNVERAFTPARGVDASRLQRTATGLLGLELRARQIVDGFLAGSHRGPRRGSSAEFAEHREYAPGDDLRYLDWKVYGKHDRYYLKQLEQETNFTCHLLLDVSPSMHYCSEGAVLSKLESAALAAAALAWLILRQQDLVGLATLGVSATTLAQPSGQASHFRQITEALEAVCAPRPESPGQAPDPEPPPALRCLNHWIETVQRRCVAVVLSDCFGDFDETMTALRHLRSRRHDVVLLHVIDPAEQDFPFDEPTRFHDVESALTQPVDCRQLRSAYRAEFEGFRRRLAAECREAGVDYALLRTDQPVEQGLAAFLSRRGRRGA
jgi:uncharacterized protein (DUF58 family)